MNPTEESAPNSSFALLRQFARGRRQIERCEFCAAELPKGHPHLIEPKGRKLLCACQPCALLFGEAGETVYRRVPRRLLSLPNFHLTDAQWESLHIPIQLAFFFHSSPAEGILALFPSPAGLLESSPDLATWEQVVEANPVLNRMLPDVEGLLVNRGAHGGRLAGAPEYYLAPIDECFRLAGLIRLNWRGMSGGAEVWNEIDQFFTDLKRRASLAA